MFRSAVTASCLALLFTALSFSQSKPNLSGNWKLNVAKSDFGPLPPPESETVVIVHAEPAFKMTVNRTAPQGKIDYTVEGTTDGKEISIKMGGRDAKVTVMWEGAGLNLNAKLSLNDQEINLKGSFVLSEEGKVLTLNNHITSAMGEFDQKMVYDKLPDGAVIPEKTVETPKMPKSTPMMTGDKPNFTGVWKLNVAKSDFGVLPPPESRTDTIEHNEPILKLARDEKGPEGARKYIINTSNDGKEVVNNWGGNEVKITANWEGSVLVATIKLKFQGNDVTIKQSSTMSADGKVLTNKNHLMSPMGELDQTEVYDKQ